MDFRFQFHNDAAEPADSCVFCGRFSSERFYLRFPGVRLSVYICGHPCLAGLSYLFWFFHEAQLRASMKARENRENGNSEFRGVVYQNRFTWRPENGDPKPDGRKQKL